MVVFVGSVCVAILCMESVSVAIFRRSMRFAVASWLSMNQFTMLNTNPVGNCGEVQP
jgi:hypothetical protein